jgi:hypothetical protein
MLLWEEGNPSIIFSVSVATNIVAHKREWRTMEFPSFFQGGGRGNVVKLRKITTFVLENKADNRSSFL